METKYFIASTLFLGGNLLIYFLLLKNLKQFRLNRYYLLFVLLLSLLIPIIHLPLPNVISSASETTIKTGSEVIQAIIPHELEGKTVSTGASYDNSLYIYFLIPYALISGLLLIRLFINLLNIYRRAGDKGPVIEGLQLILLENTSPHSFFNRLFLPKKILESEAMTQTIVNHEKAHALQKHSIDLLIMEFISCLYWFQPLIWLLRREIKENHEYLADEYALQLDVDRDTYAGKLIELNSYLPTASISSPFSYQLTKNRLKMMYKNNTTSQVRFIKISIACVLVAAIVSISSTNSFKPEKTILVMVDPGHGGKDPGATQDDLLEKDLSLSLARRLQVLSNDTKVEIKLTRDGDDFLGLNERIEMVNQLQPDLMLSIHMGFSEDNHKRGIELFIDENKKHRETVIQLGTELALSLKKMSNHPIHIQEAPFLVLKGSNCPTILIGAGFISNELDREKLLNDNYFDELASEILSSLETLEE